MSDQAIGSEVAGYRIESVIGRGGMAVVYRAEDLRLGRKVALKLLTPALSDQHEFQLRFIQESRLAASLDHPNIIPIYEAGNADDVLFIAMRYVVGSDLKGALAGGTPLPPSRTLRVFEQIGDALDAAHETGLVHRDVKPGNVLLTTVQEHAEHVYLTDFGLTKRASSLTGGLTGTGHFLGTIDYVAPEQISGRPVDARTDIYALGCVLYECLTGRVPFRREDDAATLWAHLVDLPPPIASARTDLTDAVDAVIACAMAKSPEERYDSCHAMVDDLREAFALAARVRGGRNLGGVHTSPVVGRPDLEREQHTSAPVEHPSFPPGSFPPGPRPTAGPSDDHDVDDAYDPHDGDRDRQADSGDPPSGTGSGVALGFDDGGEAQEEAGAGRPAHPVRAFMRRRKWPLAGVIAAVLSLAVAGLLLLPRSKTPTAPQRHYQSGQQFDAVVAPFTVATPGDWQSIDDQLNVDAVLSSAATVAASLFSPVGQHANWGPMKALLKGNRAQATGVWIHAQGTMPDRTSWQKLQTAVRDQLPPTVYFDGGYTARTISGMAADEMNGHFEDPADSTTDLDFLIDVVQYQTATTAASVWLVFFAAPDKIAGQQRVFDQVRASIGF